MDRQSVFSTRLFPSTFGENEDSNLQVRAQLESFILDFRLDNVYVYRLVYSSRTTLYLEDT
jgi:DNA replication licensing factor MCM5